MFDGRREVMVTQLCFVAPALYNKHHNQKAIEFHCICEKPDTSMADISKTVWVEK